MTHMETLFSPISTGYIQALETFINDWFFVFALVFLAFEFIRYAAYKKLSWTMVGDTVWQMKGATNKLGVIFGPPGWKPQEKRIKPDAAE